MSELARRLKQCKKPMGNSGKLVVEDMNSSHYELTSWGLEALGSIKASRILDIGCGGGRTIHRLANINPQAKVIGMDYSLDCVKWSKEYNEELIKEGRIEVINGDAQKIPFDDQNFDLITAIETIYFWTDLSESFKEVYRVLRERGKLLIINELYKDEKFKERNDKFIKESDMRIYSPEEVRDILIAAGFTNITCNKVEGKNWINYIAEK